MAKILLADDGIEFDGRTIEVAPLGGVESSIIHLTAELVKLGHNVQVRNKCKKALDHLGVEWRPFNDIYWPSEIDLYIANRGDKLINLMPNAERTIFWIHNPAKYLMKWRYLLKLYKIRPTIIFIGEYHAKTYPNWAPGGDRVIIPYGIEAAFCQAKPRIKPPNARVVFTSNPLRSLDWLLKLWVKDIVPRVPGAELHIFSGPETYGSIGKTKQKEMEKVLLTAKEYEKLGVRIRGAVSKEKLAHEFSLARCLLYRGDLNETFCLAVGEAQASGVPAVVRNLGSVVERVKDSETGFIASDDQSFAEKAILLMTDDNLWESFHLNALRRRSDWTWRDAAKEFEKLI